MPGICLRVCARRRAFRTSLLDEILLLLHMTPDPTERIVAAAWLAKGVGIRPVKNDSLRRALRGIYADRRVPPGDARRRARLAVGRASLGNALGVGSQPILSHASRCAVRYLAAGAATPAVARTLAEAVRLLSTNVDSDGPGECVGDAFELLALIPPSGRARFFREAASDLKTRGREQGARQVRSVFVDPCASLHDAETACEALAGLGTELRPRDAQAAFALLVRFSALSSETTLPLAIAILRKDPVVFSRAIQQLGEGLPVFPRLVLQVAEAASRSDWLVLGRILGGLNAGEHELDSLHRTRLEVRILDLLPWPEFSFHLMRRMPTLLDLPADEGNEISKRCLRRICKPTGASSVDVSDAFWIKELADLALEGSKGNVVWYETVDEAIRALYVLAPADARALAAQVVFSTIPPGNVLLAVRARLAASVILGGAAGTQAFSEELWKLAEGDRGDVDDLLLAAANAAHCRADGAAQRAREVVRAAQSMSVGGLLSEGTLAELVRRLAACGTLLGVAGAYDVSRQELRSRR